MNHRRFESRRGIVIGPLALATALLVGLAGCAQVLGLEPWIDPQSVAGAGGSDDGAQDITASTSAGQTTSATASSGATTGGCEAVGPSPTCNDCTRNGGESGIDCGGDTCAPCGPEGGCQANTDCLSGNCTLSRCEQGAMGTPCRGPADCLTGRCEASTAESTCQ